MTDSASHASDKVQGSSLTLSPRHHMHDSFCNSIVNALNEVILLLVGRRNNVIVVTSSCALHVYSSGRSLLWNVTVLVFQSLLTKNICSHKTIKHAGNNTYTLYMIQEMSDLTNAKYLKQCGLTQQETNITPNNTY